MAGLEEIQDWYNEGAKKGYIHRDPKIASWIAEGVKEGYLKDQSGGSVYKAKNAPDKTPGRTPQIDLSSPYGVGGDLYINSPLPARRPQDQAFPTIAGLIPIRNQDTLQDRDVFDTTPEATRELRTYNKSRAQKAAERAKKLPGPIERRINAVAANVLPAIAGIAGAGFGSALGPVGSLAGLGAGASGAAALQDKFLRSVSSPEEYQNYLRGMGKYREEAPIESLIAENLPNLLTGKPSLALRGTIAPRAFGAAIGAGIEGIQQYQQGERNIPRILTSAGIGAAMHGPNTRFGEAVHEAGAAVGGNTITPGLPIAKSILERLSRNTRYALELRRREGAMLEAARNPQRPLSRIAEVEQAIRDRRTTPPAEASGVIPQEALPATRRRTASDAQGTRISTPGSRKVVVQRQSTKPSPELPPEVEAQLTELENRMNAAGQGANPTGEIPPYNVESDHGIQVQVSETERLRQELEAERKAQQESNVNRLRLPTEAGVGPTGGESPTAPNTPVETPSLHSEVLDRKGIIYDLDKDLLHLLYDSVTGKPSRSRPRNHDNLVNEIDTALRNDPSKSAYLRNVLSIHESRVGRTDPDRASIVRSYIDKINKKETPVEIPKGEPVKPLSAEDVDASERAPVARPVTRGEAENPELPLPEAGDEVDTQTSEQLFDSLNGGETLTERGSRNERVVVKKNKASILVRDSNGVEDKITRKDFVNEFDFNRKETVNAAQENVRPKGNGQELESPTGGGVEPGMVTLANNSQILDSIIGSIPVDVVDKLGGKQRASEMFFHDDTVLKDSLSPLTDSDISVLSDSIVRSAARIRAENGGVARGVVKYLPALEAFARRVSEIRRGTSSVASPGAETSTPGGVSGGNIENLPAGKALEGPGVHRTIVPEPSGNVKPEASRGSRVQRLLGKQGAEGGQGEEVTPQALAVEPAPQERLGQEGPKPNPAPSPVNPLGVNTTVPQTPSFEQQRDRWIQKSKEEIDRKYNNKPESFEATNVFHSDMPPMTRKQAQAYADKVTNRFNESIAEGKSQAEPKGNLETRLDAMEKNARARINEALKEGGQGLFSNPVGPLAKFVAGHAELAAVRIARGGLKLAAYTKEMVDEYGEKIRPHIQEIWARANAIADREINAGNPDAPLNLRGLKMADTEAFAEHWGVTLPDKSKFRETMAAVEERADREYFSIMNSLDGLDVEKNPLISSEEYMVLNKGLQNIADDDFPRLIKALEKDPGNPALQKELDGVLERIAKMSGQAWRTGSEPGRRLVIQKYLMSGPFDTATVLRKAQALAKGNLSKEAIRTVTDLVHIGKQVEDNVKERVNAKAEEADGRLKTSEGAGKASKTSTPTTAQEKLRARVNASSFGEKNKVFTREAFQEAKKKFYSKISGRLGVYIGPDALGDLIKIGGYYFEGGVRAFAEWSHLMRSDVPELEEDNLAHIYLNVRADAGLGNTSTSNLKAPDNFADELARSMGRENARGFINDTMKADQEIIKNLLEGRNLTQEQKTKLNDAYRANQPKRAVKQPDTTTPIGSLRSILQSKEFGNARARIPEAEKIIRRAIRSTARAKDAAEKSLGNLEAGIATPAAKQKRADLVDVATREYANGANTLQALAKRLKRAYPHIDDAEFKSIFTEAAKNWRNQSKPLEDIKTEMARAIVKEAYDARPWQDRALRYITERVAGSRSLTTSFDLSAPLRQGGFLLLANPRMGSKSLLPMMEAAFGSRNKAGRFGAGSSEEIAHAIDADIRSRLNYEKYKTGELYIAPLEAHGDILSREEAFRSEWAENLKVLGIPIGGGVKRSERAFVSFLNLMRADNFDFFVSQIEKGGRAATPDELKLAGRLINVATGRGSLGILEKAGSELAQVFFSPRFIASRFQMLNPLGIPLEAARAIWQGNRMGWIIAKTYAQYAGSIAAIMGLYSFGRKYFGGEPVEADPRSSDFAKLRAHGLSIDLLSGFGQAIVFSAKMLTNSTKRRSGEVEKLSIAKFPNETRLDVTQSFLRGKTAPVIGSFLTFLNDMTDIKGNKVNPLLLVGQNFIPLSFPDIHEAISDLGMPSTTELILLSTFGASVNVDDRQKPVETMNDRTLRLTMVNAHVDYAKMQARQQGDTTFDAARVRRSIEASTRGMPREDMIAYLKGVKAQDKSNAKNVPVRSTPVEALPRLTPAPAR